MRFAFIVMGPFDFKKDRAVIAGGKSRIVGVADIGEACSAARELQRDGIDCVELCGAFGEAGAKKVIDATGNKLPVGYVVHLPEQEHLYEALFSKTQ